jgi:hypothetical protein
MYCLFVSSLELSIKLETCQYTFSSTIAGVVDSDTNESETAFSIDLGGLVLSWL